MSLNPRAFLTFCLDDSRTVLQQASAYIRALSSIGRPHASPSTSPSTSSIPASPPGHDNDGTRLRIEAMTRLITILQRNLRVRYELDVAQVVQA